MLVIQLLRNKYGCITIGPLLFSVRRRTATGRQNNKEVLRATGGTIELLGRTIIRLLGEAIDGKLKLGFIAPPEVKIYREELFNKLRFDA